MAAPSGATRLPTGSVVQNGCRLAAEPPGIRKQAAMIPIMAAILTMVKMFWVRAPSFRPKQLSTVRAMIETTATTLTPTAPIGMK